MGLTLLCLAEAGSRAPLTGGFYAYIEIALGPLVGFMAGALLFLVGLFGGAAGRRCLRASVELALADHATTAGSARHRRHTAITVHGAAIALLALSSTFEHLAIFSNLSVFILYILCAIALMMLRHRGVRGYRLADLCHHRAPGLDRHSHRPGRLIAAVCAARRTPAQRANLGWQHRRIETGGAYRCQDGFGVARVAAFETQFQARRLGRQVARQPAMKHIEDIAALLAYHVRHA